MDNTPTGSTYALINLLPENRHLIAGNRHTTTAKGLTEIPAGNPPNGQFATPVGEIINAYRGKW